MTFANAAQPSETSTTPTPEAALAWLQASIEELLAEVQALDIWGALTAPGADPARAAAILREVYREVALYQPDVISATVAVIGEFPRTVSPKGLRTMLVHQSDEWDHGEMAMRDFVALGGQEFDVRHTLMTPTAFATAAFWRMLAHKRLPFAYLGALYLFEGLTPLVTGLVRDAAIRRGTSITSGFEYVEFHATEDIKHAKVVDHLILQMLRQFPERADEVRFGFLAFRQVYPLPGWTAAARRALALEASPQR